MPLILKYITDGGSGTKILSSALGHIAWRPVPAAYMTV